MITDYFLDESGNSGDLARPGRRFDFGQQEVFTLACLGVPDAAALGEELTRMKVTHRVQAAELKSSSVRDKPGLILDLAECVQRMGLPLFVEVVDKRFMIAANIVHTHTLVARPVGPCDLTLEAQWLYNGMAEYIHRRAPSAVFESFVSACDSPAGPSVTAAFTALLGWLKGEPSHDVAMGIQHFAAESLNEFQEMGPEKVETQRCFLPSPDTNKRGQSIWMLPNLSSLTNIYARLNRFHRRKIGSLTLFHDQQVHFDDILRAAKRSAERLVEAAAVPSMRFADFHFEEEARLVFTGSHASPGIQAADVLAGFLMRYVKDALYSRCPAADQARAAFGRVLELSEPSESRGINFVLPTSDVLRLGVVPA
jgi:hypothetical protein